MRVLIADRDGAALEILQTFLWERGYDVEIAGNGLECMAMLREFEPDVLVLDRDLLWGGCDGVMSQMHEDPVAAETPVILMVNENLIEQFDTKLEAPLVGLLWKPIRLSELLGQLTFASQNLRPMNLAIGAM